MGDSLAVSDSAKLATGTILNFFLSSVASPPGIHHPYNYKFPVAVK